MTLSVKFDNSMLGHVIGRVSWFSYLANARQAAPLQENEIMNVHVYERLWHWLYASEGAVPYMYLDKVGLVTIGIGFMIETKDHHINPQWLNSFRNANGTSAAPDKVAAEFDRVKGLTALQGAHLNFKPTATVFMPDSAMKPTVLGILRQKETALKTVDWMKDFYQDFDFFPPDAQMGCLSTAYGGMYNTKPAHQAFNQACKDQRWADAAESHYWDGWEPPKIAGHKLMFRNAQVVKDTRDSNPQPAFPGLLAADGSYEIDDQIRPYRQDIWKAGTGN